MKSKNNESFGQKLLKRFYGTQQLDEYREKELHRINSHILMSVWWFMLIMDVVFVFMIQKNPETTAWVMLTTNLIIYCFAIPLASLIPSYHLKIIGTEVEEKEFIPARKKMRKIAIFVGIFWGFFMYIFFSLFYWWQGESFIDAFLNLWQIILWTIGGFLFGFLMWFLMRSKLKKADEE
ncbi:DUF3278 domain-containing protein [Streptococcus dentiloxodontae]